MVEKKESENQAIEENQLQVIVRESGLDKTKAQYILDKFVDYFKIASEWDLRAKTITVTSADQTAEMSLARVGRLFLREKRIAIEKSRKELKEQCLREGKAIDGISNVLKALISPIEDYLEKQERFVEIKEAEEREKIRLEVERKIEEERIAKEKAIQEEQERIRLENIRLKEEAEAKEKAMQAEREKAEAEKKEIEAKAKAEREKAEKARIEKEKQKVTCPECGAKFIPSAK